MGKTYRKTPRKFDDDRKESRSGSHRHVSGKKTRGMPIINSVIDDESDDDYFDDELHIADEIYITHNKNT